MAGSYRHLTHCDGSYRGIELLDNLGDAEGAIEELWHMVQYLSGGDREDIFLAYKEGWGRKHLPAQNVDRMDLEEFWR